MYVADLEKIEILKSLGLRIKRIRLKQKVSRYQLAFEIKTSEKLIRQIESGEINTSVFKIYQIADALGVKPEDLLKTDRK